MPKLPFEYDGHEINRVVVTLEGAGYHQVAEVTLRDTAVIGSRPEVYNIWKRDHGTVRTVILVVKAGTLMVFSPIDILHDERKGTKRLPLLPN